jgi:hypothetical protein
MKAEAFRDDLASRAFAGITANPAAVRSTFGKLTFEECIAAMSSAGASLIRRDLGAHPIGYAGGGTDCEWRFTHTDGSSFIKYDPAPGESYGAWAMKCAEEVERTRSKVFLGLDLAAVETGHSIGAAHVHVGGITAATTSAPEWANRSATDVLAEVSNLKAALVKQHDEQRATISFGGRRHGKSWFIGDWLAREARQFETMWVDEADDIPLPAWFQLKPEPASAEDRAVRKSGKVTLTIPAIGFSAEVAEGEHIDLNDVVCIARVGAACGFALPSDGPGIAAMAAKNVQPTPEPVVRVGGEQVTQREIAQALALLRGQNAPAVKETPRGLMYVREGFDHRLGAWRV